MTEVDEAISQIDAIRRQMARAEVFRGYRAVPVAGTGLLAFATAALQGALVPDPGERIDRYLALWLGAAIVGALWAGLVTARQARRRADPWARRLAWVGIEPLMPALVAGALLTLVLARRHPSAVALLPGLWQVLFGLGLFASLRHLPRAIFWVAVLYLLSGVGVLAQLPGESALGPWVMGLPFGVGQLVAAAILYWTLERSDERIDLEG